jgi:hypothetical protein
MSTTPRSSFTHFLGRLLILLLGVASIIALSTMAATWLTTRRIAQIVGASASRDSTAATLPAETDVVSLYTAAGVTLEQVEAFLATSAAKDHLEAYPLHISFWNDEGDCLVNQAVIIEWQGGSDQVIVGASGMLRIMLRRDLLPELQFHVAKGYTDVIQKTLPFGERYRPYSPSGGLGRGFSDFEFEMRIWRQLARQKFENLGLSSADAQSELRRTKCDWKPHMAQSGPDLDAADVYRLRRESVVIVGHLLPDDNVVYAAGVIVDPAGIVATAYHVMDKPDAVSRCIATAKGECYPIVEIVAADKSRDVALIKVAAEGLSASPLSTSDDVGAPLTIISHPGAEFFSVTEGTLRRYQAALLYGVEIEQMVVTADFTDGASGGPIFNQRGEVAGIVSFRRPSSGVDFIKVASPSSSLRALSN